MFHKKISILEDVCNGCGSCVIPCQNNAITIIDNKAKLLDEKICVKFAHCVPLCPVGAIVVEETEETHDTIPRRSSFEREKIRPIF